MPVFLSFFLSSDPILRHFINTPVVKDIYFPHAQVTNLSNDTKESLHSTMGPVYKKNHTRGSLKWLIALYLHNSNSEVPIILPLTLILQLSLTTAEKASYRKE